MIKVDLVVTVEKIGSGHSYTITADNWDRKHTRLNDQGNTALYADEKTAKTYASNFCKAFQRVIKDINDGKVKKHRIMQGFLDNKQFDSKAKIAKGFTAPY